MFKFKEAQYDVSMFKFQLRDVTYLTSLTYNYHGLKEPKKKM